MERRKDEKGSVEGKGLRMEGGMRRGRRKGGRVGWRKGE